MCTMQTSIFRLDRRARLGLAAISLGILLSTQIALAQNPVPLGDEFQINTDPLDTEEQLDVAASASGDFVVVWHSIVATGDDGSTIQGQRFDSAGNAVGNQFRVNSFTSRTQREPAVAADAAGNFVVVWQSQDADNGDDDWSIQGQRFDALGAPIGDQFLVNTYTTDAQMYPDIAMDASGNFNIVWMSLQAAADDDSWSIQGQRFDADGTPFEGQFQINTYTVNSQRAPVVALTDFGGFVVVWESVGPQDSSGSSIHGRVYGGDGAPMGSQFPVNTFVLGDQRSPTVAMSETGGFVVAWESQRADNGDSALSSVQAQLFAADGTKSGGQFLVNTETLSRQDLPDIAMDADGNFTVLWSSFFTNQGSENIKGQRYDAGGTPIGTEFQASTSIDTMRRSPEIAMSASGDFVVVWSDFEPVDSSGDSVRGRRFCVADCP